MSIAGVVAVALPIGQAIGGRVLVIPPDSAIATSEWGTVVDRMVRADQLRVVRLERPDTLVAGRIIEQRPQY